MRCRMVSCIPLPTGHPQLLSVETIRNAFRHCQMSSESKVIPQFSGELPSPLGRLLTIRATHCWTWHKMNCLISPSEKHEHTGPGPGQALPEWCPLLPWYSTHGPWLFQSPCPHHPWSAKSSRHTLTADRHFTQGCQLNASSLWPTSH